MLRVRGLDKGFGGNPVLKGVNLQIQQGEVVGLIGPNGSGKTTLFSVISGFFRPKAGSIQFEGREISRMSPEAICMLGLCRTFQITKPFSNIPVVKNVMIGALCREKSLKKARMKAEEVLELVGMRDKKDLLGKSLTIADRKRLEIARGLATSPKLFLLDEVMAGLNPNELNDMIQLVTRITKAGITLFFIEHIMTVIMNMSQRVIVLDHGEVIAEGTPAEVSCDPNCVRAYLGEDYLVARSS